MIRRRYFFYAEDEEGNKHNGIVYSVSWLSCPGKVYRQIQDEYGGTVIIKQFNKI